MRYQFNRSLLLIIAAFLAAFFLSGCGDTAEVSDQPKTEQSTPEEVIETAEETTETEPEREQISWDLTDLYATPDAWKAEIDRLNAEIETLSEYEGTLGESATSLADALTAISATGKEVWRAYVYASMTNDEDQRISESQEALSIARQMASNYSQSVSWISPEVLEIGPETILSYIEEDERLSAFDHQLEDILSNAEHTLGAEAESVLAAVGLVLGSPNGIYEILVNANVPWPTVTLSTGEELLLNQAGYTKARSLPNREDRIMVFDTFWSVWQDYLDSNGQILSTEVNSNVAIAKVRNYESTLAMQLSSENIPTEVYDTLVEEVNAALPTLHRYFNLRAKMLGIEQMHYYDIYPPLVELDKEFDIETSRDLTLASLTPLGEEYTDPMKAVAYSDWIHVYPQPGKRSGAYMNGGAYDVHPYVLLNHNDDFNSLSTYAHELGHAVHTILTTEVQPFEKADYSTFIAEIASQINEILLEDYMLKNAETKEEKLFYLGYSLESMRGSFYRQTMFSEFEHKIHQAVESGEPLSGERMSEIYGELLKTYHGHDEGVVIIDDTYTAEWSYIPHFYYDFYVYQYSTSIAGAAWFAEKLLEGDEEVQKAFIELLQSGGSDYPYDLLKKAGLDMASPEPYRAAVRRMDATMDEIEALLAE